MASDHDLTPAAHTEPVLDAETQSIAGSMDDRVAEEDVEALALAMVPPKEYQIKLKGKGKCVVQAGPMGLVVADKKGKNPKTYLYQTMEGWNAVGQKGELVILQRDEKAMVFECPEDVSTEIADTMNSHAEALAKSMAATRKAEKVAKKKVKPQATSDAVSSATVTTVQSDGVDADSKDDDDHGSPAGVVVEKSMVAKGLAVWLTKDSKQRGVILKKAGKNVHVDFSESGGEKKYVAYAELSCTAPLDS